VSISGNDLYYYYANIIQSNDPLSICRFLKDHSEIVNSALPDDIELFGNFSGVTPLFGAILNQDLDLVRCLLELKSNFDFYSVFHNISAGQLYINTFPVGSLYLSPE
jgi:ankyrin repeat protein